MTLTKHGTLTGLTVDILIIAYESQFVNMRRK